MTCVAEVEKQCFVFLIIMMIMDNDTLIDHLLSGPRCFAVKK